VANFGEISVLVQRLLFIAGALAGSACTLLDEGLGEGTCGSSSPAPEIGPWSEQSSAFEARVLELTNAERQQGGCCGSKGCFQPSRLLATNGNLEVAARRHARDMAERNFFAHEGPDGTTLSDRLDAAGFRGCAAGENIAYGQSSPEEVVADWMKSEGHCTNILSSAYRRLGVGYYDDSAAELRRIWVQNFGD
jgi:uncharacterized protein YkwD